MSRIIVNIRGCNGSGKSSIPMSMLNDPKLYLVKKFYQGKERNILTIFPSFGWVALGAYQNKTGGLDGFPNTELTKKVFWYVLKHYPDYNVLLEGVIASTVFSTYAELFVAAKKKYPEDRFVVLILNPPLETCLKRIQKRNGGKPIKEDLVANKWKIVDRSIKKFQGVSDIETFTWDNRGCKNKGSLPLIKQMENIICLDDNYPPF